MTGLTPPVSVIIHFFRGCTYMPNYSGWNWSVPESGARSMFVGQARYCRRNGTSSGTGLINGLSLVHHSHLRLHIGIACALLRTLRPANIQHEPGQVEVAHVAGDAVQFRQAHLHNPMARPDLALAGSERVAEQVGGA